MALTEKQQAFVEAIATDRLSYSAAYSKAFDVSGMQKLTVAKRASELARKPEIQAEINVILEGARRNSVKAAAYSLDDAIAEVDEGLELAKTNGQSSAFLQGVKLKAQLAGHVIDRKEVSTKDPLTGATIEELGRMRDEITRRMLAAKAAEPPDHRPIALHVGRAA